MTAERPIGEDDLHAYVDGHLRPERRAAIDDYLKAHPDAAAQVSSYVQHREELRQRLSAKGSEPIPTRLRVANIMAARKRSPLRDWQRSAAAAAIWLLVGSILGATSHAWIVSKSGSANDGTQQVGQEAIAAYRTYVTETAHPVEVGASQEAHLVQWLSRRVGKPLHAPDLTGQGYRLIGGRLLPAEASPAALFMYEDSSGRRLTLYARTDKEESSSSFRFESQGDISAFSWIDKNLSYVITGRIDRNALLKIAETVYHQSETVSSDPRGKL
ncbi:anti-sigma factor family protein [Microvirga rosea]|uniref:anti-sigma factor family protein n=1 Tax=Microvirga rosea TaxID=2715425 RepID=UPI001D0AF599|nr:anti-sigma factor [Microvirga rosea]MCB8823061.1 anti-sigma factor [Microvirga rosea]